jgi:hypothetical protein
MCPAEKHCPLCGLLSAVSIFLQDRMKSNVYSVGQVDRGQRTQKQKRTTVKYLIAILMPIGMTFRWRKAEGTRNRVREYIVKAIRR